MSIDACYCNACRVAREEAAEIERLREALQPFADAFKAVTSEDVTVPGVLEMSIQRVLFEPDQPTIADLQRAFAALSTSDHAEPKP